MKLDISQEAVDWYRTELDIDESKTLRFFVRYGGVGGKIPGFSLGITSEQPEAIHASAKSAGITFYIEESDAWYFEDSDLEIKLNKQLDEPEFNYI
ncbi:uncharacterized protein YneR [Virgibacillus halotolerans]|uniref:HesB/YadR/YfhF family protein n=1 Tax=Virgibacillus halotolerans TaxID=1071053 RepID=UPI001960B495|nr:hypothetical protein [Virgibacillus halotolerans]MBM7598443.1 uncharacterized protein YneR [Virgibacillus halotolerans]